MKSNITTRSTSVKRLLQRAVPAILVVIIALPGCAQAGKDSAERGESISTKSTSTETTASATAEPTSTTAAANTADPSTSESRRARFSVRPFGGTLDQPVWVGAPKGSSKVFAIERGGRIIVRSRTGSGAWKTFLNIRSKVNDEGGEQGLLSMAFAGDYERSGKFFVYYTDGRGDGIVARYKRDGSVASKTEKRYLKIPLGSGNDEGDNHNGGQLQFGPDGSLYVGIGDGGGSGDPQHNGQNLKTLLGKMLRINVSGNEVSIPAGNPFTQRSGAKKEIYYLGLRNPWRFSFDRSSGDLWIGDVGQGEREEVNVVPAPVTQRGGLNFGWNRYEGNISFSDTKLASGTTHTRPNYTYDHNTGGCSITGGYVYRGTKNAALRGTYVFADYCDSALQGLRKQNGKVTRTIRQGTSFSQMTSFGEDGAGELLVAAEGRVYRIT